MKQDDVTLIWHLTHALMVAALVGLAGNLYYRRRRPQWNDCRWP